MRQSNRIQLSPEDTAITASSVRLTLTRDWNLSAVYPAPSGRSQLHRAHRRRCARHRRILHVTPKATKVKAAGDRLDCKIPAVPAANHKQTVLYSRTDPRRQEEALSLPGTNLLYHPVPTSAFATLDSVITLTSSGTSFAYTSSFSNVPGTPLSITGAAQLTWATSTLEAYSVTSASDYPTGLISSSSDTFVYTSFFSDVAGTSLSITIAAQLTRATEMLEAYGVASASDYPTGLTSSSGTSFAYTPSFSHVAGTSRSIASANDLPHRIYRLLWHQLEGEFRGGADGCVEQG
ncbi:hypothetical protein C8R44DRAFT_987841 [Mycena epipterygia]|nr:hypothetical protein C8R44DRAFT_987841 [Mycena epipterygia]